MSGSRSEEASTVALTLPSFSLRQTLVLALLWLAASASARVWSPPLSDPMASGDSLDDLLLSGVALENRYAR
jgi:hypothetical protein